MKEHPILFSTPMVQAILAGKKTQTRRIVKHHLDDRGVRTFNKPFEDWHGREVKCPYGNIGDRLWVRERFYPYDWTEEGGIRKDESGFLYYSDTCDPRPFGMEDETCVHEFGDNKKDWPSWKPSIHMPRTACRINIEITNIRVERLQDISNDDAKSEGAKDHLNSSDLNLMSGIDKDYKLPSPFGEHQFGFMALWCKINGVESWIENPFVWVIQFKRINQ